MKNAEVVKKCFFICLICSILLNSCYRVPEYPKIEGNFLVNDEGYYIEDPGNLSIYYLDIDEELKSHIENLALQSGEPVVVYYSRIMTSDPPVIYVIHLERKILLNEAESIRRK